MSETPEALKPHEPDYKPNAWANYTEEELQWWVRLLRKRAVMRTSEEKKRKDLYDANNYEVMLNLLRQPEPG